MKARWEGYCSACHRKYPGGTEIIKKDGRWVHAECPGGAQIRPQDYDDRPIRPAVSGSALMGIVDDATDVAGVPTAIKKAYVPSAYQLAVNDEVAHGTGNVVVDAGPGSGKTTTIVHALELTPEDARVAFVAFNRHIAKELQARAPQRVHVSTLHSLGLSALRRADPRIDVNDDKLYDIIARWYPTARDAEPDAAQRKRNRQLKAMMKRLVSISKAILVDVNDPTALMDMVDRYNVDIDADALDELLNRLPEVMDLCKADTHLVDYDDMIWLPVVLNMAVSEFDYLFVDEAQDLNRSQMVFIQRSLAPDGRIIAVGDPNQSLYAFRGADADAIPNLIRELNAKVLPLSITYRCPTSHVHLLNDTIYNAHVEPAPNAKAGTIGEVKEADLVRTLQPGDMVLCRTNAPLIDPAFACVRAGKKAIIRGRDIGKSLVDLIERFDADTLGSLDASLGEYFEREYTRFMNAGKELQADLVKDKVETIRTVMAECETDRPAELIDKIMRLFSDDNVGIVFSSVHRAKGLEADRVFILHEELMPHPKAKRPWEQQQERNCMFVAYSRSKDQLMFVR